MIVIVARAEVQPGQTDAYIRLAKELETLSRREDGCIAYTLHRSTDDPSVFVVIEQWIDRQAIEAHNASEHFRRIVPQLGAMRRSGTVEHLTVVE